MGKRREVSGRMLGRVMVFGCYDMEVMGGVGCEF